MESEYSLKITEDRSLYSGWKPEHEEAFERLKKKVQARDTIVAITVTNPRYKAIHG